ncbi:MAG: hypothetical protein ACYTFK_13965 [Planctomycetota bacterium]|jgi:hypothetical protein
MKKIIVAVLALLTGASCFAGQLTYTTAEVEEAVRLTLEPGHLAAQLPETNSPIVTVYTVVNQPTNLQGVASITLTDSQDFTFDTTNSRFFYSKAGATNIPFKLTASLSIAQNAANAEITVRATKNSTAISGVYFKRTISTSNVIGVGGLNGHFTLTEGDYVEISVESDKVGNFNSWSFATDIIEEAQ